MKISIAIVGVLFLLPSLASAAGPNFKGSRISPRPAVTSGMSRRVSRSLDGSNKAKKFVTREVMQLTKHAEKSFVGAEMDPVLKETANLFYKGMEAKQGRLLSGMDHQGRRILSLYSAGQKDTVVVGKNSMYTMHKTAVGTSSDYRMKVSASKLADFVTANPQLVNNVDAATLAKVSYVRFKASAPRGQVRTGIVTLLDKDNNVLTQNYNLVELMSGANFGQFKQLADAIRP